MPELHALPERLGTEILRVEVGSTLHGTGLGVALEDRDEMSVYVEGPRSTIGFAKADHYMHRTAAEGQRSGPDDTDLAAYSLRKWAGLAVNGNPTVLLILFAPADKVLVTSTLGAELREHASWFSSKRAGKAFLGYMEQQRQRMVGQRGKAGRVRIMPDGGVDWKYAMHMLRLGYQGEEFLTTGRISLPIPQESGDYLRAVRKGEVPFDEVIADGEQLEARVKRLLDGASPLPDQPDVDAVERFVIDAHFRSWRETGETVYWQHRPRPLSTEKIN